MLSYTFLQSHSEQATLHVLQNSLKSCNTLAGFYLSKAVTLPKPPGGRVIAHMPLRIALTSFTPNTNPRLGVKSQHQKLHRCALRRIFRPAFRDRVLTRILHHQLTHIIISHPIIFDNKPIMD